MNADTARVLRVGQVMAAVAAVLFSAKAILAKFLYAYDIDAITLMALRMGLSLPVFAVVAVIETRRARARGDTLGRRDLAWIVLLGFLGYYLSSFLDFWGLEYVTVSLERLILFLTPTLVAVISLVWLGKPVSARQWAVMAASYAGLMLVFVENLRFGGAAVGFGAGLVFAAAMSYALYLILSGELVRRIGSLRLVAYAMCVSTVLTLAHFLLRYPAEQLVLPLPVYGLSAINALACTVLPVYLTMFAIKRLGAPATAQFSVLGPVSLVFLGAWLLDEPVTALQLTGTAIVIAAMLWFTRTPARAPDADAG
jgi:drug/metabolite transporter (DMT)-like permease